MKSITEKTRDALIELGANPSNSGFEYMLRALEILEKEPDYLNDICLLYSNIADNSVNSTATATRVERAIRHMVDTIVLHSNYAVLNKYVSTNAIKENGRITNSAFIASLHYKLADVEQQKASIEVNRGSDSSVTIQLDRETASKLMQALKAVL